MCCNNGNNPVGTVNYFARQFPPEGWLLCDGREVSRNVFADLFNMLGISFGTGDGKTTFNLPDLRGEFIRGCDMSRGVDSGRVFGDSQTDSIIKHEHGLKTETAQAGTDVVLKDSGLWSKTFANNVAITPSGEHLPVTTFEFGGTETRPRNVALLACIKY